MANFIKYNQVEHEVGSKIVLIHARVNVNTLLTNIYIYIYIYIYMEVVAQNIST